jgi:hypothetical protein
MSSSFSSVVFRTIFKPWPAFSVFPDNPIFCDLRTWHPHSTLFLEDWVPYNSSEACQALEFTGKDLAGEKSKGCRCVDSCDTTAGNTVHGQIDSSRDVVTVAETTWKCSGVAVQLNVSCCDYG